MMHRILLVLVSLFVLGGCSSMLLGGNGGYQPAQDCKAPEKENCGAELRE